MHCELQATGTRSGKFLNRYVLTIVTAVALAGTGTASSEGAPISIFNTGVAEDGAGLVPGSIDPHYSLIVSDDPLLPGPGALVTPPPMPLGWLIGDDVAQWISPSAKQPGLKVSLGSYIFRTTFDLAGMHPSSANLAGHWAVDNLGLIFLNGQYTGYTNLAGPSTLTAFDIDDGFVEGENVLDFIVINSGTLENPTGLMVRVGGRANKIPEPTAVALALLALSGLIAIGLAGAFIGT